MMLFSRTTTVLASTMMLLLLDHTQAGNPIPRPIVKLGVQARRWLNLGNLLSSPTKSRTPYDRILGHPVFQVTTAWGSTYMTMERKSLNSGSAPPASDLLSDGTKLGVKSVTEGQSEYNTIAVFYMDPDDAMSAHAELMQLDQMKEDPNADIRIMSTSMGKAVRQASNVHELGLLTGQPIDKITGKTLPPSEGGVLRYKILPSQRQLYYAARCYGRERVGLGFMEGSPFGEAVSAVLGTQTIGNNNVARRQKGPTDEAKKTPLQRQNAHMDGYTGIPVFYVPHLHRKINPIRRMLAGKPHKYEIPMFFNYEDMERAWKKTSNDAPLPSNVEVFNLWDVLTSMDKQRFQKEKATKNWREDPVKAARSLLLGPIASRLPSNSDELDLSDITFVPSSRNIDLKETLSKRGNGKARLRPMR